jgi:hypothetical protein
MSAESRSFPVHPGGIVETHKADACDDGKHCDVIVEWETRFGDGLHVWDVARPCLRDIIGKKKE